jgi:hypothetical protein
MNDVVLPLARLKHLVFYVLLQKVVIFKAIPIEYKSVHELFES